MKTQVNRQTVDLSAFPDLVVIYLGMRVRTLGGIKALLGLGPQIDKAGASRPDGLLHFENNIVYSFFPLHLGMRWYWKDFESMERWVRSEPHRRWWQEFLRSSGGIGFWHETYFIRGGMEAIYDDVTSPWDCRRLHLQRPRVVRCFLHAIDSAWRGRHPRNLMEPQSVTSIERLPPNNPLNPTLKRATSTQTASRSGSSVIIAVFVEIMSGSTSPSSVLENTSDRLLRAF
ncbi:MAG: monooxygenase family protein [Gammaproteobacteria bacterium]